MTPAADDPYYEDDGDPADGEEPPRVACVQCGESIPVGRALCDDCFWAEGGDDD